MIGRFPSLFLGGCLLYAAAASPILDALPSLEIVTVLEVSTGLVKDLKRVGSLISKVDSIMQSTNGKIKMLNTGFTTSNRSCYNPPPLPLGDPSAFSASFKSLAALAAELQEGSSKENPVKRPGLQAALLAAADKTHVGFSDFKVAPKVTRIMAVYTTADADFLATGTSKMKGDGTDTCASGPPDAAVVAKILKERDVILLVGAVGDTTVAAWQSYGAALKGEDRGLYHVISLEDMVSMSAMEQMMALRRLVATSDVKKLIRDLQARFKRQGGVFPDIMPFILNSDSSTPTPSTTTAQTSSAGSARFLFEALLLSSTLALV